MPVATWSDVVSYVQANYKIADQEPNMLKLVFDLGNMRSQLVFVWRVQPHGGDDWVQIESPIGELGNIDLPKALTFVSNTVCGGLAMVDQVVTFRHSLPLDNLSIAEFEVPLAMVTKTADEIERTITGGDQF